MEFASLPWITGRGGTAYGSTSSARENRIGSLLRSARWAASLQPRKVSFLRWYLLVYAGPTLLWDQIYGPRLTRTISDPPAVCSAPPPKSIAALNHPVAARLPVARSTAISF